MSETDQSPGDGVIDNSNLSTDIPPCKFKIGDWVKLTTASSRLMRFQYVKKNDIGIVTNVVYITKKKRRWWLYENSEEKYHLVTIYWQNSVHRKTGHESNLREKRLKFASRKRKTD